MIFSASSLAVCPITQDAGYRRGAAVTSASGAMG
jgi:hypothetical protein